MEKPRFSRPPYLEPELGQASAINATGQQSVR